MPTSNIVLITCCILVVALIDSSFSCERLYSGKQIEFVTSYENDTYQRRKGEEPDLEVISCKDNVGEYLVLKGAPVFNDMTSRSVPIPGGDLPTERRCKIKDTPFDISTLEETNASSFFKAQGEYINQCLVYEITDTRGVIEPLDQPETCAITYLSKNKILAKGSPCIIKILGDSEFKIRYHLDAPCYKKDFMVNHPKLTPMYIKGVASVDIYGCNYYMVPEPAMTEEDTPALYYSEGDLIEYSWAKNKVISKTLLTGVDLNSTPLKGVEFNNQNYQFAMKELSYIKSIGGCGQMVDKGEKEGTNLALMKLGIRIQPEVGLLPSSTYYGDMFSIWPTTYETQVAFGAIGISQSTKKNDHRVTMKIPLLVNNNCSKSCLNGICSSPCNFSAPLAARMTLKRRRAGTANFFEYLDVWNLGGIVSPSFLGRMTFGKVFKNHDLKVGDRYELIAEFFSPSTSYNSLKEDQSKFLVRLKNYTIIYRDGLQLPILRLIPGIGGLIPNEALYNNNLPSFFDSEQAGINYAVVNRNDPTEFVNAILAAFKSATTTSAKWPPYYDKVCFNNNCDRARDRYLTLKLGFSVKSIHPATGAARLEGLTSSRISHVFGNKESELKKLPDVTCKNNFK